MARLRIAVCSLLLAAEVLWMHLAGVRPAIEASGGWTALLSASAAPYTRLAFPFLLFALLALAAASGRGPSPFPWTLLAAHAASLAGLALALSWHSGLLLAALGAAALITLALAAVPRWHGAAWPALGVAVVAVFAADVSQRSWEAGSAAAIWATHRLLQFLGWQAWSQGATVGVPGYSVVISPACSGYEGMGLIFAFSAGWLLCFRREYRFPAALLLLPAGIALSWMLNIGRIAALILIGASGRADIAQAGFHSQAGWMAFTLLAAGFCTLSPRIPGIGRTEADAAGASSYPAAKYLAPFIAMQAGAMISAAASGGFEWLYPLRVAGVGAALWHLRREFRWSLGSPGIAAGFGAVTAAIWIAATPAAASPVQWIWLAFRAAGGVLAAPIAEELAFRGCLMRWWRGGPRFDAVDPRRAGWLGLAFSSAAFGAMHGARWLEGTVAGLLYGAAYAYRGRLSDAIAAHAVTNLLLLAVVAWTRDARYW